MIHTLCLASTGVSRASTATPAQTRPAYVGDHLQRSRCCTCVGVPEHLLAAEHLGEAATHHLEERVSDEEGGEDPADLNTS